MINEEVPVILCYIPSVYLVSELLGWTISCRHVHKIEYYATYKKWVSLLTPAAAPGPVDRFLEM